MNPQFDHEKLHVYEHAQLDRASTSVPLNIAEGNGKFAMHDRCRFIEIARGSALECAACLDVLVAKGLCDRDRIAPGKKDLFGILSRLTGLQNSRLARVQEEPGEYHLAAGVEE